MGCPSCHSWATCSWATSSPPEGHPPPFHQLDVEGCGLPWPPGQWGRNTPPGSSGRQLPALRRPGQERPRPTGPASLRRRPGGRLGRPRGGRGQLFSDERLPRFAGTLAGAADGTFGQFPPVSEPPSPPVSAQPSCSQGCVCWWKVLEGLAALLGALAPAWTGWHTQTRSTASGASCLPSNAQGPGGLRFAGEIGPTLHGRNEALRVGAARRGPSPARPPRASVASSSEEEGEGGGPRSCPACAPHARPAPRGPGPSRRLPRRLHQAEQGQGQREGGEEGGEAAAPGPVLPRAPQEGRQVCPPRTACAGVPAPSRPARAMARGGRGCLSFPEEGTERPAWTMSPTTAPRTGRRTEHMQVPPGAAVRSVLPRPPGEPSRDPPAHTQAPQAVQAVLSRRPACPPQNRGKGGAVSKLMESMAAEEDFEPNQDSSFSEDEHLPRGGAVERPLTPGESREAAWLRWECGCGGSPGRCPGLRGAGTELHGETGGGL